MVLIDYKKAYDKIPQCWQRDCQKMYNSHKVHQGNHEKVESDSSMKSFSWGENPDRYLPELSPILFVIATVEIRVAILFSVMRYKKSTPSQ